MILPGQTGLCRMLRKDRPVLTFADMKWFFPLLVATILLTAGCKSGGDAPDAQTGYPEIDQASAAIQAEPRSSERYYQRAEAYLLYEGYDQAIRDLKQAIQLDSNNVAAWHLLADAYLDYYNSRMAMNTLYDAVERFPTRVPTLLKLTEFQYTLTLSEGAKRTITRILELDPMNADAWFWRGMILRDEEKMAEAIRAFQKATELDPFLIDAWVEGGKLLSKEGKPMAQRFFQTAIQLDSLNPGAWHALAEYQQEQGQWATALETYRELVRFDPYYTYAYYNSGLIWLDQDSLNRAVEQFSVATKVEPTFAMAYYARAGVLEIQGKLNEARRDYEQALVLDPAMLQAKEALDRLDQKK